MVLPMQDRVHVAPQTTVRERLNHPGGRLLFTWPSTARIGWFQAAEKIEKIFEPFLLA